jgi:hypothetical protein
MNLIKVAMESAVMVIGARKSSEEIPQVYEDKKVGFGPQRKIVTYKNQFIGNNSYKIKPRNGLRK